MNLIKKWEGCRLEAYQDSAGVWTIGWGTTAAADVGVVPRAGMKITQVEADKYLAVAVEKFAAKIRPMMTRKPTEGQWEAMLSLAYNIGPSAFSRSTVLRLFNSGDFPGAADAFLRWNRAGGKVVQGLKNRRADERAVFLRDGKEKPQAPPTGRSGALWAILAAVVAAVVAFLKSKGLI